MKVNKISGRLHVDFKLRQACSGDILQLQMQEVFGIWNTKYHLPKKYLKKYLNNHKLTCIWYSV